MIEEVWKDIFENYEISNLGRLKSKATKQFMCLEKSKKGYLITKVIINGKRTRIGVHRLVAIAFIPNPNNYPQVNHKDENPGNNSVDNLEWCTNKYNSNYGSSIRKRSERVIGEKNPFYGKKHTEESKRKMSNTKRINRLLGGKK